MHGNQEFFGFGQARNKPTNRAGSGYSFMFGRTTSGKPVNERTAMQTDTEAKKLCPTEREMTTPLFLLGCVQLGLSIAGLELLSIG